MGCPGTAQAAGIPPASSSSTRASRAFSAAVLSSRPGSQRRMRHSSVSVRRLPLRDRSAMVV